MSKYPIIASLLYIVCISCSDDSHPFPEPPGLKDTHWLVKIKWDISPDTFYTYIHFLPDGSGTEETADQIPLDKPLDWQQDKENVNWTYRLEDTYYFGKITTDGQQMSGTCRADLPPSDELRGTWTAVKR